MVGIDEEDGTAVEFVADSFVRGEPEGDGVEECVVLGLEGTIRHPGGEDQVNHKAMTINIMVTQYKNPFR